MLSLARRPELDEESDEESVEDQAARIRDALERVLEPLVVYGARTIVAHLRLAELMPQVNRAWRTVRRELDDIGLLYAAGDDPRDPDSPDGDGRYLDRIELEVASLPSVGEAGYVFERVGGLSWLCGYREGVIYLPADLPRRAYVSGSTLTDVIRHEFGHAWHWLDPEFFERPWFRRAFGGEYADRETRPSELFEHALETRHRGALARCRSERERESLTNRLFEGEFVSSYAATRFCEDFAETFRVYLRHRRGLDRFASRPGVFRKLTAIRRAVARASRELGSDLAIPRH